MFGFQEEYENNVVINERRTCGIYTDAEYLHIRRIRWQFSKEFTVKKILASNEVVYRVM